jgi:CubicO group peptidase (beta-lactamase class C family)
MTSGYCAAGDTIGDGSHGQSSTPFHPSPQPVFTPPGSQFAYWDSAMNMFGLVLTRIAGEPMQELLKRRIGDAIGMSGWTWGNLGFDNGVLVNGTAGMISISALDMARFGYLFLNQGNWNGWQLVSANWVKQISTVQIPLSMPWADPKSGIDGRGCYGLNWWCNGDTVGGGRLWSGATPGTYGASGIQNNKLFVIPEWQMVVVRLGLGETDGVLSDAVLGQFLGGVGQAITGTTNSVPASPHTLAITRQAVNLVVTWDAGILQMAGSITGPWSSVTNASSSFIVPATSQPASFFRTVSY